jgi:N-acetylmuramoyl-L-alanine amidase
MTLKDRAAFAQKVGADLFVSLHMNAVVDAPYVTGSEVFYSVSNNTAYQSGLKSQDLAAALNMNLKTTLGSVDRGVKTENYTVIYRNTVPAV